MRYPTSEKREIIRLVEQAHLPAKQTLDQLGIARRAFYRWYDGFLEGGPEALEDRPSAPSRVWNHIGENIQGQIAEMALEQTELSPLDLAMVASSCDGARVLNKPRQLGDRIRGLAQSQPQRFVDVDITLGHALYRMVEHRTNRQFRAPKVTGNASKYMPQGMRGNIIPQPCHVTQPPQALACRRNGPLVKAEANTCGLARRHALQERSSTAPIKHLPPFSPTNP